MAQNNKESSQEQKDKISWQSWLISSGLALAGLFPYVSLPISALIGAGLFGSFYYMFQTYWPDEKIAKIAGILYQINIMKEILESYEFCFEVLGNLVAQIIDEGVPDDVKDILGETKSNIRESAIKQIDDKLHQVNQLYMKVNNALQ